MIERLKFTAIAITFFIVCWLALNLIREGKMTPMGVSMFFMLGYPLAWMLYVRIKVERDQRNQ